MNILSLLLFILILSFLIFVHELGHFLMAKKFGAYVYEFAIGMGPKIYSFKRKNDPTLYSIRAFPIGGYCAIAGEVDEEDRGVKLKKNEYMCNKTIKERCFILIAGVTMNFITGFIILLLSTFIWGFVSDESFVGSLGSNMPAEKAGIEVGDRILKIDGKSAKTWDDITLLLNMKHKSTSYTFTVKKTNGEVIDYNIIPELTKDEKGEERKVFGIGRDTEIKRGFLASIKYTFTKLITILTSMFKVIINLALGNLPLNSISGPIGVYTITKEAAKTSIQSVLYLTAYLSLNLGFINIMPFPAFDGGRVLFLIIEGIRKKKMNPKVENAINGIGFAILMLLMLAITIKDVFGLFN